MKAKFLYQKRSSILKRALSLFLVFSLFVIQSSFSFAAENTTDDVSILKIVDLEYEVRSWNDKENMIVFKPVVKNTSNKEFDGIFTIMYSIPSTKEYPNGLRGYQYYNGGLNAGEKRSIQVGQSYQFPKGRSLDVPVTVHIDGIENHFEEIVWISEIKSEIIFPNGGEEYFNSADDGFTAKAEVKKKPGETNNYVEFQILRVIMEKTEVIKTIEVEERSMDEDKEFKILLMEEDMEYEYYFRTDGWEPGRYLVEVLVYGKDGEVISSDLSDGTFKIKANGNVCQPECRAIGTRSEGWHDSCNGKRIKWDNCAGCQAVCQHTGSKSEGWYSSCDGKLIRYNDCLEYCDVVIEPCEPDEHIEYFIDETQEIKCKMPRCVSDQTSVIPPAGFEDDVITAFVAEDNPFSDTNIQTLEGIAGAELYRRAVIGGYPDGKFKGYRKVNRAEAAKFLLLARYGKVDDLKNNGKFRDVLEGQWYVKYIVKAANFGIIQGYPDGLFQPARTVNTAEFLKMLILTFGLEENLPYTYTDIPENIWYGKYVGLAQKYDLFPNKKEKLDPEQKLTRNEVAVAIYQYLKNKDR